MRILLRIALLLSMPMLELKAGRQPHDRAVGVCVCPCRLIRKGSCSNPCLI